MTCRHLGYERSYQIDGTALSVTERTVLSIKSLNHYFDFIDTALLAAAA
jgi:hypothetical protein